MKFKQSKANNCEAKRVWIRGLFRACMAALSPPCTQFKGGHFISRPGLSCRCA